MLRNCLKTGVIVNRKALQVKIATYLLIFLLENKKCEAGKEKETQKMVAAAKETPMDTRLLTRDKFIYSATKVNVGENEEIMPFPMCFFV